MKITQTLTRGAIFVYGLVHGFRPNPRHVVAQVEERLNGRPYLALDEVSWMYRDGVLKLSGSVGAPALKKIAEALAFRIPGIERIVNEIAVCPVDLPVSVTDRAREARPSGPTSATF